jgi:hypothetical protein
LCVYNTKESVPCREQAPNEKPEKRNNLDLFHIYFFMNIMLNKIPQHVNVRNKERTRRRDAVFDDNFTAFKKGKERIKFR